MEELVEMFLERSSLWRIFASQQKRLFELTANGRCLFVYLHLVPSLLQEIGTIVIASVGVTKRNMFHIVIRLIERITNHVWEERMATSYHIYQHTLARTVSTYDC